MITIRLVYNEYKITISNPGTRTRGISVFAKNQQEIHEAIDHYFGKHTRESRENCPSCRSYYERLQSRRNEPRGRR